MRNGDKEKSLAASYSSALLCAVPSAMKGLTSEFGMGSGVPPSPMPPSMIIDLSWRSKTHSLTNMCQVFRLFSIGPLNILLRLHSQPIDHLILMVSIGIPYLRVGLAFRCFQRLSSPNIATRLCTWQYNRYTIGLSTPVLSY